jgi:hypothetical protein
MVQLFSQPLTDIAESGKADRHYPNLARSFLSPRTDLDHSFYAYGRPP